MGMSKKDYVAIANILAGEYAIYKYSPGKLGVVNNVMFSLADYFKQNNPNFDRQKFYDHIMTGGA